MSIIEKSIREIHTLLLNKETTVSELLNTAWSRIEETDNKVNAFVTLNKENAPRRADQLEQEIADITDVDDLPILAGIPGGIKDNICTQGMPTTCSSKILSGYKSPYSATVMKRLHAAGAVPVGKLNMDEFAMGSSTENSSVQLTKNPWNLNYVPGGSSGGSAASVAAGQVVFSLGSDTGGSIRQPAAYCGVVGLKPTYGLVSRYGLVAYASSLDQIGPITRNVEDTADVLQAIAGYDEMDSTSANVPITNYREALTGDIKGLKIAIAQEYMGEGIDSQVREVIEQAVKQLVSLGAEVEYVSLPHTEYALPCYYLLASAEASSNLARYDGVKYGIRAEGVKDLLDMYKKTRSEGFGDEVKRRIMLGTYALSSGYYDAYYLKAQKVRTLIKQDFDNVFAKYDIIIGPTAPTTAFKIGEKTSDPLTMYLNDICTIPVNLAGLPAISIPCGFVNGLPVGLQIIGKAFDESTVLRAAHAFEQSTNYHKQRPTL
ncbi:Asp-tRNA(Asn)/Glu-tRNA(Gln) amidotransferase subunit GatA [Desulfuribacillus alkaliarsenatis]|uniref:Glutamyl-tRNA(Gln) amidotransferase subunit A n=1 Tax=Desulfuribacillus alkaliarsenatis TaxID=766136 RepID=A0A1E5G263_9FIRM|nr:Asp-tRNA(Asn)/Glu-tRNA(Gln) amidotransferase subunit GatA [Desulfuribacillus alkaliarsenatis]OEF97034.1 aspartyl/glutamyl-tRNA amidotransferase subunit A [Desulfuribacillus alkaliarsenatis]